MAEDYPPTPPDLNADLDKDSREALRRIVREGYGDLGVEDLVNGLANEGNTGHVGDKPSHVNGGGEG